MVFSRKCSVLSAENVVSFNFYHKFEISIILRLDQTGKFLRAWKSSCKAATLIWTCCRYLHIFCHFFYNILLKIVKINPKKQARRRLRTRRKTKPFMSRKQQTKNKLTTSNPLGSSSKQISAHAHMRNPTPVFRHQVSTKRISPISIFYLRYQKQQSTSKTWMDIV